MNVSINFSTNNSTAAIRQYPRFDRTTSRPGALVASKRYTDVARVNLDIADRDTLWNAAYDAAKHDTGRASMILGTVARRFGHRHYWEFTPKELPAALAWIKSRGSAVTDAPADVYPTLVKPAETSKRPPRARITPRSLDQGTRLNADQLSALRKFMTACCVYLPEKSEELRDVADTLDALHDETKQTIYTLDI